MKTMRRSNCILFIKMMILSTLAFSCRGLNDRKVDPVVIAHAKAVIDSNFLHSPYLQVAQYEFNTAWLYIIAPKHSFWFWTEKGGPDNAYELPTDFLEYKGKFIFFYLKNKKRLSEEFLDKTMRQKKGENYIELDTHTHMDTCGIWVYFKDKYSDRSAYVHCGDRQPFSAYPELRYFLCNEQDSSVYYSHIIDMRMWKPYIYGTETKNGKFLNPNQIEFSVKICNRTDSALYISTRPEEYGHFVFKDGENSLTFHVSDAEGVAEVSPGMYEITPHTDIVLDLSTEKNPIVFKNVPRKKYPEKIHQMVYDSVYYLPTHTVSQSEKRYIWNKKFKVYPLYLNSYYYRIDSVEHTVFWDGEIDEIIGRKFKR